MSTLLAIPQIDINTITLGGTSALILASYYKGDTEIIRLLLAAKANVNAEGPDGMTPLMDALLLPNPDLNMIKVLVKAGADVNHRNRFGATPLSMAKECGDKKIILFLEQSRLKG